MKSNRHIFALLALFFITLSSAQNSLNDYKYVIVPNQFDFQREADQYRLNSLSKFLFEKNGFIALKEGDALPKELVENGCLSLNADVLKGNGMFKTKLRIELKNCRGEVVYTSDEGISRKKKYMVAYNEALRGAFKSFSFMDYKYNPSNKSNASTIANANDKEKEVIRALKEEIKALKKVEEKAKEIDNIDVMEKEPKSKMIEEDKPIAIKKANSNTLYAQPTNTGFQLVDTTPKVVYTIYVSGKKDTYIVKGLDALIYKENGEWTIAEQKENGLEERVLNIKF